MRCSTSPTARRSWIAAATSASWWTPAATASAAPRRCARRPIAPRTSAASARPVALPAMSAIERRLVHEYLRDRHEVETYSEGEEPDRHLVVAPVVD